MRWVGKILASLALLFLMLLLVSGISPVYRFAPRAPFSGPDIFNPYASLDTAVGWKRAVFHTHSRVKGPWPVNECPEWPAQVDSVYRELGYDIVTFSNHNEITRHPYDTALQVNVYEHGYSIPQFHKLVFGSDRVIHWDAILPLTASQKQFQLNYLGRSADFLQLNHPYRVRFNRRSHMERLSGYQIMELDTHISTENEYWDWALSYGHYSFGLANDDNHNPFVSSRTGIRCNFLNTPSGRYEDLRKTLLGGCYYAMRVPDYGQGDWEVKRRENRDLPRVEAIGLEGPCIFLRLSEKADSIRVNGAGHRTLKMALDTCAIRYSLPETEPYARLTAFFPDGAVLYTNPFARYDAAKGPFPPREPAPPVNGQLTILFNLLLLALTAGAVYLLCRLWRRSGKK